MNDQLTLELANAPPERFEDWVIWTRNPENNPQLRGATDSPPHRNRRPARPHPAPEKQAQE